MAKLETRKAYARPNLKTFGGVAALTAAGSGTNTETGSLNNPNRRP